MVPVYLSHHPNKRAIYTTYQAGKAAEWGRKSRDVIERYSEQLGISVRGDSRAANAWDIAGHRGGMITAGVGGPLVGSGADLLIVDDPIKNHEEADSELIREKLYDWLESTAFTRLEPDSAVILIMHRWRRDDIVGKVKEEAEKTGEKWEVVRLPALAEDTGDILGRAPGQCLWPQRFTQAEVEERKLVTAPRWWNALYQQDPKNEGGSEFPDEWFQHESLWFDEWPTDITLSAMALDPSKGRDSKTSDFQALVRGVRDRAGTIYVEGWLEKIDTKTMSELLVDLYIGMPTEAVALEVNGFQELLKIPIEQAVRARSADLKLPIVPIENMVSKIVRIRRLTPYLAKKVFRFKRTAGTKLLVDQLKQFPNGTHDDGPDAAEAMLRVLIQLSHAKKR